MNGPKFDLSVRRSTHWQVTLDGSECDKVGVGYTAFRYQAEGCARPEGHCLHSQLADMAEVDEERIANGQSPIYFITSATGKESKVRWMQYL